MKRFKLVIVLILVVALVLLVIQNTASVQAHFLGFTAEMSLVLLLFLTGALGFISGLIIGFMLKNKKPKPVKHQPKV